MLASATTPEMQTCKILLDECVLSNLEDAFLPSTRYVFHCSSKLVGTGAKDADIVQFAHENRYLVVTKDNGLVIRCINAGVPVAYYDEKLCKAYTISITATIETPKRFTVGAPIKVKKAKRKQKPSLFARIKKILSSK